VFTGFNWQIVGDRASTTEQLLHLPVPAADHDTDAKEFTFAIYPDGGKIIPARAARNGEQDALDLILALARIRRRRGACDASLQVLRQRDRGARSGARHRDGERLPGNNYNIKAVLRTLVHSQQFRDPANFFQRYSWPAEFVVRAIKETGWTGFSVNARSRRCTTWASSCMSRPTSTGGSSGRAGSRPRRCCSA
jgi:hypothetical protein